jgi:DNA-binding transcriptional ArsR family regulator
MTIRTLDIVLWLVIIIYMDLNMIEDQKQATVSMDAQAQVFKILTHPARIAILNILRDGEHCVCHMEANLGFRQSYISQQLAVLREAGLIADRREGWNIFYQVINPQIYDLLDAVSRLTGAVIPEAMNSKVICTCPQCNPVINK